MKYGYFDGLNKEYVITTYNTPLPWINYLSNGKTFSLISNLGGGYTYFKDAKLRRITRFEYNSIEGDNRGRMIYIKDGKDVFSPTFFPSKTPVDSYECHVGLNYLRFISSKNNLEMNLLCFIPLNDNVEINKLILRNKSNETKKISLISGVEFCLWNALDDMTNFQRNLSTGEVEVVNNTIFHKTEYRERRNHFAYYSVNKDISSFSTARHHFVGKFRSYQNPIGVDSNELDNYVCHGYSPVAFFKNKIELKPNEEITIVYQLGYFENDKNNKFDKDGNINKVEVNKLIEKYKSVDNVDKAFNELNKHWDNLLNKYHIETSDEKLANMVNIFHPYQCVMTYHLSRSASYYESGIGRGMGFRDSCQDLLGFVHLLPNEARSRILDLASIMFEDGSTYHQYQPLDKKGNADIGGGFNDDPLWIIAATYAYLAETGDYSILDEIIPFNNDENNKTSLLKHLDAAFNYIATHKGPHGLPLIGHADWNDCLNLNCFSDEPGESFQVHQGKDTGIAESVFIAGMFVKYGKEYAEILSKKNIDNNAALSLVKEMEENIIKYGYEKDHFLRAYDAFGNKVGSYTNKEGQIYIEPQGMCVMAGVGLNNGLASKALDVVYEKLNTKYGICLLTPCYTTYHIELGEITSYPQGYKENGGIFSHNNPWIIIAECLNDNVARALTYYKEITPTYIEDISDIHQTEPYAYSQMVAGKETPDHGTAKNSWLTGTASWTYVAVSQYILGIRPTLNGLVIDPKIEDEMDIQRIYKGKKIHVHLNAGKHKPVILHDEDLNKEGDIYVAL